MGATPLALEAHDARKMQDIVNNVMFFKFIKLSSSDKV